ncbi:MULTISPECIES: cytochrome c oxidase subunit 3 [unclassified Mesorhizobium]|uniref:cytochrome c oxidase subunit 3 n=1 Tax=unclassified Mesorhizobium TaxID=325217 RepID=UPI000FD1D927|nr:MULTISPECIES: cytochrome c oxidase subunit 3 [unclassified Mesorhizobium]RUW97992.1 cytochrome C oxidase subunit III [Mesorhizobium sp. M8A.F.Ca.ET.059.01.1.1]RVD59006.1 cytochrome C oxidase subunit III [Mesorhizobium sp. M8A.F.Ca.ET.023.02.2.1]TGR58214.1 cytochrome C oxidase subunit III [bacterium M00.F.Ca.ET.199.01.1.1]TGU41678.1 cytochrome C oxidase subunit III [bacterium M00.F.Ca.ET.156.01.1.1]TGU93132.1 cytochrome C oxidase subunit III [Mesorhizobium sp. M00.F.Ca.ET.151.01.1.1]TGV1598
MKEKIVIDLADLPPHGLGSASQSWWGTLAFMLIEGTGFALAIAVYLYLMSLAPLWPLDTAPPDLLAGTILTVFLVLSVLPNILVNRWARQQDLRKVRIGLIVMSLVGIVPLILRAFEFPAMHIKWDQNAYGSIVWVMLGLHTTHILTDVVETLVLTCLMFSRHADNPRRFGDVNDNAMYWNFVVATWLPMYACLYWVPRL